MSGRRFLLVACRSARQVGRGDGVVLRARIAMLRRHGEVTVLSFGGGDDTPWPDPGVRLVEVPFSAPRAVLGALRGLPGGLPIQAGIWRQPAFVRAFRGLLATGGFDAVGFITLRPALALEPWLAAAPPRRWLEMIDLLSENMDRIGARAPWPRRALMRFEARRLVRAEARAAALFAPVILVNPDEAARHPGFIHLPLSLAPGRFHDPAPLRPGRLRICVSGNFTYFPNREAAGLAVRGAAGLVAAGTAELTLLGRGAPALAATLAAGLPIGAEEPADMALALAGQDVALCPVLTFTGMQNKILEAAAAGLIVIASPGPAAVIGLEPGRHFLPATDAASLAAQLAAVLADPGRFGPMRRAAQEFVRAAHDQDRLALALDRALDLGPPSG